MTGFLIVALGGSLGAMMRYGLSLIFRSYGDGWPFATLTANTVGCALMGVLYAWLETRSNEFYQLRLLLGTGILGGFTTFSAFSLETFLMLERKAYFDVMIYIFASIFLGLGALIFMLSFMRKFI